MTRIIAGGAGSLRLEVPRSGTRPTSDRVREALFSQLEARDAVEGARVLDLYAGTGALGLEALSRGAAQAVLVERAAPAVVILRRNADAVSRRLGSATVRVEGRSVSAYLESAAAADAPFDLVFVDPPYDLGQAELGRVLALVTPSLSAEATVVVERSARSGEPAWPAGLAPDRAKHYGETSLWFAGPDVDALDPS